MAARALESLLLLEIDRAVRMRATCGGRVSVSSNSPAFSCARVRSCVLDHGVALPHACMGFP